MEARGRPIHSTYLGILTKWVEAYFNKFDLDKIGDQTVRDYYDWLETKFERPPAKSTINHHNTVIRAIFDRAANDKVINRGDIPKLTIKGYGRPNQRRPHFGIDEIQEMMESLHAYQEQADRFISRYKRHLMRHYVAFLLETGMRPGLEVETLTWDCIDEVLSPEGKKCIRVWVLKGKRGHRKLIANDHASSTLGYLLNYRETHRDLPTDRDWLWTAERAKHYHGQFIFAMPDGTPLTGVSEMFKRFLIDTGLYTTINGEARSLYSCRHSFITFALIYKSLTVQEIAAQCGTCIEMISRHYSHVIPEMAADRLSAGIAHYLPYKL